MHMICKHVYSCHDSKKKIEKEENWYAMQEGDYHNGLGSPIRFCENVILKNYDEADKWIDDHDNGWYDCLAVQFKDGRKKMWLVKTEFHC